MMCRRQEAGFFNGNLAHTYRLRAVERTATFQIIEIDGALSVSPDLPEIYCKTMWVMMRE